LAAEEADEEMIGSFNAGVEIEVLEYAMPSPSSVRKPLLAQQKPAWEPGERQAYHAITLGYYQGELLRRLDPQHRTLGHVFQDEIASPLGLDVYIR
jgi:CubicO group peptidase (beta-lactamase class C family)